MRRLSVELRLSEICVFFLPKNIPRHHSRPRFTFLLLCAAIPKICIEGGLTEGPFPDLPVKETTANRIRMTRNLFICLFMDVGNFKYFSTAKEGPQQAKLLLVGVLRVLLQNSSFQSRNCSSREIGSIFVAMSSDGSGTD